MAIGTTAAIVGATAISAGGAALSARSQGRAAERAADAQVAASDRSAEAYERVANQQIARMEPFRQLGISAISPLQALLGLSGNQPAQNTGFSPQQGFTGSNGANYAMAYPRGNAMGRFSEFRDAIPNVGASYVDGGASNPLSFSGIVPRILNQGQMPNPMAQNIVSGEPGVSNSTVSALEALQNRPGYQFRLNEGIDAVDASAAGRGMLLSGAQQRALTRYGQDYASAEYDNEINRLLAVMGGGQVATNSINAAQGAAGAGMANAYMNAGNARASGYLGQGQATANAIGGVTNAIGGGIGAYGGYRGWFG